MPGELIVVEIMNNPNAVNDAVGEYFEITNVSSRTIELAALEFADLGADAFFLPNSASIPLAAGGLYVLGKSTDTLTNGGATVDYAFGAAMNLANGDDEVIIRNAGVLIDEVRYDGGPIFPDPTGASMNLDPSAFSALANDDGANWCEATSAFGDGDLGTPKTANDVCPECTEDFDGDDMVGFTDLTQLLGRWGPCAGCPQDLDGDGQVGFTDLTQLLGRWGPC
jgi:hypothetical protein